MPIPFDTFTPFDLPVPTPLLPHSSITIHGVRAGTGPPLLLLHGNPQTYYIWHIVAPQLADHFTVVATDLRGYGASSKPEGDETHEMYSKREMARDQVEVMKQLGFERFYVIGHDRGARVAHRMAVDWSDAVESMILLDIAPTLVMYETTDMNFATAYYHWFMLIQPAPFPEQILTAASLPFLYRSFCKSGLPTSSNPDLALFSLSALDRYISAFQSPGTIHAICEDYRASATIDLTHDRADIKAGRKIACSMVVLWGEKGYIGKGWKPVEEWEKVAREGMVKGGRAVDSGHFIPEHAPGDVVKEAMELFTKRI